MVPKSNPLFYWSQNGIKWNLIKNKSMKYDLENPICYLDDLLISFLAFNKWTTRKVFTMPPVWSQPLLSSENVSRSSMEMLPAPPFSLFTKHSSKEEIFTTYSPREIIFIKHSTREVIFAKHRSREVFTTFSAQLKGGLYHQVQLQGCHLQKDQFQGGHLH